MLSLEGLKNTQYWPDLYRSQKISVVVERVITANRRIDISVHIIGADGKTYCLAIENKPRAGDLENQVQHSLEYLSKEYDERFLLIYISGTGEGPSEWSIHETELEQMERPLCNHAVLWRSRGASGQIQSLSHSAFARRLAR